MITFFKGLHYKSALVYNALTFLKLGTDCHTRFKIASNYIKQNESVLDLCSGDGTFQSFLPAGCNYECIEMSPEFSVLLVNKNIRNHSVNLHDGLAMKSAKYDIAVMLISLCHFRDTSLDKLLEELKIAAKRVLIIEDVLAARRSKETIVQRIMNYLCSSDYYVPLELFTVDDFKNIMNKHGYTVVKHSNRYYAGIFDSLTNSQFVGNL